MIDSKMIMRNSKLDNIKGISMILVVMGHLLELDMGYGINKVIYVIIYSFHMPVFVFISGYFANFKINKIWKKLLYPYLLFQILYLLFDRYILGAENTIQFVTPYWLLWYLWAMIVWTFMIPIIKEGTKGKKTILLVIATMVALLVGYENAVGRMMSLSRIFVFFPFFLCGYYAKNWNIETVNRIRLQKALKVHRRAFLVIMCICMVAAISYCIGHYRAIDRNWLYEAVSYRDGTYNILFRIIHLSIAMAWLVLLLLLIPNKRIPLLTSIGINTMPIFLMHGFIIKMIGKYQILNECKAFEYFALLFLLGVIVLLLSSKPICKLFVLLLSIPEFYTSRILGKVYNANK